MIDFHRIEAQLQKGQGITRGQALELLQCKNHSQEYHKLLALSDETSRRVYGGRGYVFTQIGLNAKPCSGACKFCSLSKDCFMPDSEYEISEEQLCAQAKEVARHAVSDLFLMTTADYDKNKFLKLVRAVKDAVGGQLKLVANVGDFDVDYAKKLKEAGAHAAYHIVRLREGLDTGIKAETRIKTLDAIMAAGLELYYCVEPIGSEHTYDEILDEAQRAKDYGVSVMAVMKRVNLERSPLHVYPEINSSELIKIAAAVRLFVMPKQSMNVHEVTQASLLAGVNQLYAEIGVNPRDTELSTEKNRGVSIQAAAALLSSYEYKV